MLVNLKSLCDKLIIDLEGNELLLIIFIFIAYECDSFGNLEVCSK